MEENEQELKYDDDETEIQPKSSRADHLKPWQFQPGQSGNPGGKPPGTISLKTFAKNYLLKLNDEEKLEFLKGMNKDKVWEMAEDKAGQGVQVSGEVTTKIIAIDE